MRVRKPLYALGLMSLTTIVAAGLASPAGAAQVCEAPPPGTGNTCFLTTTEAETVEQPVPGTVATVETFTTRVVVNAPDGTTFDQTVDAAPGTPAVADLTAAATASVNADGLEVTSTDTSAPQRSLVSSSTSEVVTPDREDVTTATETIFGPDTIQAGPDRSETVVVPDGTTAFNTVTTTTEYVNVATNTTNTYLTTATVTITAEAPAGSTSTTTTTPPSAASPGSTNTGSGELARTGRSNGPWTAIGVSLVLAGAGCIHLSRRTARRGEPLAR